MTVLVNIGGTNEFYTHPSNVLGFGESVGGLTDVYLVGREATVKINAPISQVVALFEEQLAEFDAQESPAWEPPPEFTEEEIAAFQEVLEQFSQEEEENKNE